ncbi:fluoride efflux transporter FluC [Myceligenerans indicum]|uniref:Fluoride-specific ion channel FluC n=1 Tax=Myceligenerans indicum TaxID=2593663 RepID=A0ABS1LPU7_9MICO|nr:CrcB family protein [Myceligenerans indicum]MBL0887808.1 CrcB family protein [Myceligenerans indicum]
MTGLLLVAAGGAVGAAARFMLDGAVRTRSHGPFPWGTFTVNVLGSLAIGVVAGLVLFGGFEDGDVASWRLALATGLCGGFTTFSTAMVETVRLARSNRVRVALISTVGTLAATVVAVAAGIAVVGLLT